MGAKQSKRSVDISGKEAEGAGEVAAAGAGGEGRVEQLADADTLKPQLNGDAHIEPPQEQTDKEKQLDSGTPENEKDATTEKEGKEQENEKEKETVSVTNGEPEQKTENGETTPTTEEGKKPKKEKVKKKWSLRSISFSRKDKPKQEKKHKEEDNKTNGEPEKVPEEAAEATPETVQNKEEAKSDSEAKNEKTPETPVTEPLTNGSSTPESPKVETPVVEEPTPVSAPAVSANSENATPEVKSDIKPEQLTINGLSLDEPKVEDLKVTQAEESKPELPMAESTETVPAPEIPVKTEVCVEQMPSIESTPPPLPANPPPSSVASFAATTMAPELTDALLANTADTAISTPSFIPDIKAENNINEILVKSQTTLTNTEPIIELPSTPKETVNKTAIENMDTTETPIEIENKDIIDVPVTKTEECINRSEVAEGVVVENVVNAISEIDNNELTPHEHALQLDTTIVDIIPNEPVIDTCEISNNVIIESAVKLQDENIISQHNVQFETEGQINKEVNVVNEEVKNISVVLAEVQGTDDDFPLPPPPADDDILENVEKVDVLESQVENIPEYKETIMNSNHISEDTQSNGIDKVNLNGNDDTEEENLKNKTGKIVFNVENVECNGNVAVETLMNGATFDNVSAGDRTTELTKTAKSCEEISALSEASEAKAARAAGGEPGAAGSAERAGSEEGAGSAADWFPPPPGELHAAPLTPQDPLPVSDKLADLISEIPTVPDLKTETETTTDIAVAN